MKTSEFTPEQELASAKAESRLARLSKWIFIIGLTSAGILLVLSGYNFMSYEEEVALQLLIVGLPVAIFSTITWAVLNVLCGISFNLRMLNSKTLQGEKQ